MKILILFLLMLRLHSIRKGKNIRPENSRKEKKENIYYFIFFFDSHFLYEFFFFKLIIFQKI
jgi:hypothetical protein